MCTLNLTSIIARLLISSQHCIGWRVYLDLYGKYLWTSTSKYFCNHSANLDMQHYILNVHLSQIFQWSVAGLRLAVPLNNFKKNNGSLISNIGKQSIWLKFNICTRQSFSSNVKVGCGHLRYNFKLKKPYFFWYFWREKMSNQA